MLPDLGRKPSAPEVPQRCDALPFLPQDLTIPESSTVKGVMAGPMAAFKWQPTVSEVMCPPLGRDELSLQLVSQPVWCAFPSSPCLAYDTFFLTSKRYKIYEVSEFPLWLSGLRTQLVSTRMQV